MAWTRISTTARRRARSRVDRHWPFAVVGLLIAVVAAGIVILWPSEDREACGCTTEGEFYANSVEPDEIFVGLWLRQDGEDRPLIVVTGDDVAIGDTSIGGDTPDHESIFWAVDDEVREVAEMTASAGRRDAPSPDGSATASLTARSAPSAKPATSVVVRALWQDGETVVPVRGPGESQWPEPVRRLYAELRAEVVDTSP